MTAYDTCRSSVRKSADERHDLYHFYIERLITRAQEKPED